MGQDRTKRVRYAFTGRVFGRQTTFAVTDIESLLPWLNTAYRGEEVIYINTVVFRDDDATFDEKLQEHLDGVR